MKLMYFLLFLVLFTGPFAQALPQILDADSCGFWLEEYKLKSILEGKWDKEYSFDQLKERFFKNGVADLQAWEEYKKHQPGQWIKLKSGRNIRAIFIESDNPHAEGVTYTIEGIGNSVERYLTENYLYVSRMDNTSHDVMIETGGLTDFDEYMQSHGRPREVISLEDVSADVHEAIVAMQSFIKNKLQHKVKDKVNLIGLSAGGWFLSYFAAHPQYNDLIDQVVMQAPGGQSLDEYFNPMIRPMKDFAEQLHPYQKPFVDAWNMMFMGATVFQTPHEIMQSIYGYGAANSMRSAFHSFKDDNLRLQFATARVKGLAKATSAQLIPNIPRRITLHLILGGQDMIVPPGLFANIIEAMNKRDQIAADGKMTFTVMYFTELGHNLPAEVDVRVAAVTQRMLKFHQGMLPLIVTGMEQPQQITVDQLAKVLREKEKKYLEVNQGLLLKGVPRVQ